MAPWGFKIYHNAACILSVVGKLRVQSCLPDFRGKEKCKRCYLYRFFWSAVYRTPVNFQCYNILKHSSCEQGKGTGLSWVQSWGLKYLCLVKARYHLIPFVLFNFQELLAGRYRRPPMEVRTATGRRREGRSRNQRDAVRD